MDKTYRVWAHVEEQDSESYRDLAEPVPIGDFDTAQEADAFLKTLTVDGEGSGAPEQLAAEEREREQGDGEVTVAEMAAEKES